MQANAPTALEALRRWAADLEAAGAQAGTRQHERFVGVLPEEIGRALGDAGLRDLTVQLAADLDFIPLEELDDGRGPLGQRFAMVRHITREATPSPPGVRRDAVALPVKLRVLVVAGPGDRCVDHRLVDDLDAIAEVTVASPAAWPNLSAHDVVLWLAAANPREIGLSLSQRPIDAALWVFDDPGSVDRLEWLHRLRDLGQGALFAPQALRSDQSAEFLRPFLGALCDGLAPAEAARRARCAAVAVLGDRAVAGWRLYQVAHRPLCARGPALVADGHRQVTVLSFDLVESTRLLHSIGSERYGELLADMHSRCLGLVHQFGGSSEEPRGDDGLMCYFGMPVAMEDAATRALQVALAMHASVRKLPEPMLLRIGVATGRLAIRAGQVVGPTIHVAARLRALAAPGEVIVDDRTRSIAASLFRVESLAAEQHLKGIDAPVRTWRLVGRVDAPHGHAEPSLAPFVGREAELSELMHRWQDARLGGVHAIVVRGEPGIGKSRLVREFQVRVQAEGTRVVHCEGRRENQGSAFKALSDTLKRLLQLHADDPAAAQRAAIAAGVPGAADNPAAVDRLARMLGLSGFGQRDEAPSVARERTLALLSEGLWAAAEEPLVLIVEDLQWLDPSTSELLGRLLQPRPDVKLLVLCTARDDEGLAALPEAETLELGRLSALASRWLIREVLGEYAVSADLLRRMAERADGVPLYLEESARVALDAGADVAARLAEVPASVDGLLMSRLDRLGERGKPLAQVAAVLGREFSAAVFEAVVAHPLLRATLHDADGQLKALLGANLLLRRELHDGLRFAFRHELMRDVAYLSMWQRDRDRVHQVVAQVLASQFPDMVTSQPELLAEHLVRAGAHLQAVDLWEHAARAAASRSGNDEAIRHLRAALAAVAHAPVSAERDRIELRLQLMLAARLIAAQGYGSPEVEAVYGRASELCERTDDTPARLKVRLGLESVHVMRANLETAEQLALEALASASRRDDPMARLQARWALSNARFHRGNSGSAIELMDACLDAYQPSMHRPAAVQDPGVMCLCYSAWAHWELGRADEALRRIDAVLALAQQLSHQFSRAEACGFAAAIRLFRGETVVGLHWAEQAVRLCEDAGFSVWLAHARIIRGRLWFECGETALGLREMAEGYALWTRTGAVITRPFYLALQAESHLEAGDPAQADVLIDEALALVACHGERYHEAELIRLSGLVRLAGGDVLQGEARLAEAHALALAQGKHAFALRSAIHWGSSLAARGLQGEAAQTLRSALARIPEGLQTRDPQRATVLLNEWSNARTPAREN